MPELAQRVQVRHVVWGSAPLGLCAEGHKSVGTGEEIGRDRAMAGEAQVFFVNHSLQIQLLASGTVAACWETSSETPAARPV